MARTKKADSEVKEQASEQSPQTDLESLKECVAVLKKAQEDLAEAMLRTNERIAKLELKIDAVEKISARRKYSAEEIFKVQNPF